MRTPKSLRVECYRNLHMDGVVWSVREVNGKVLMHVPVVVLKNVRFVVQEAGRQKVIRTGHKNVHAFAKGELVTDPNEFNRKSRNLGQAQATYNPYRCGTFTYDPNENEQDMRPLFTSRYAVLSHENDKPKVTVSGVNEP